MVTLETESLGSLEWIGIVFAAVSGVIHLVVGVPGLPSALSVSFLLAAGGFFGAITLILIGWRRRLVYAVGIPFTASQIVLWYVLNGTLGPTTIVDKVAQVGLVVLCVYFLVADEGSSSPV